MVGHSHDITIYRTLSCWQPQSSPSLPPSLSLLLSLPTCLSPLHPSLSPLPPSLSLLSLPPSRADLEEASYCKSSSHKEMNSANKLREPGTRYSPKSVEPLTGAKPWPTCCLQPCEALSRRPADMGWGWRVGGRGIVTESQQG